MSFEFKTLLAALTIGAATCTMQAQAQAYRLPGQHAQQQSNLQANQKHVDSQYSLSLNGHMKYAEELAEPDIYTEGWNSGYINCYNQANVPQTDVIDVRNYCIPSPGVLTSAYGYRPRFGRMHRGVDIGLCVGDTVRAAFNGRVRITSYEAGGYGYYVVVRHNNKLETVYGHFSKILVKPNQYVKAGDPVGLGGSTGLSTGPHLHFETRYMGYAINPEAIFDFRNKCTHTDYYTFDKRTYEQGRNYAPATAQTQYTQPAAKPAAQPKAKAATKTVTVQKGDSLSKIAARNGISLSYLCKLNGLKSTSNITPGQKLRVK